MDDTAFHMEHFVYDSGKPGTTLVVLGAIHGNEKCGTEALTRLKSHLDAGTISLTSGRLIIVPIANPGAYKADKRFLERNLNRSLYPKSATECTAYEDHLDAQICAVIDEADYVLDIHSYTADGPPFVFIGCRDAEEKSFAEALGVTRNFVWDWQNAFKEAGIPEKDAWGVTGYARSVGARALTLECGQHKNPQNADVAYAAALHAMQHLKLAPDQTVSRELSGLKLPEQKTQKFAKMVTVIRNEQKKLARDFKHFEPIKAGEVLALCEDGGTITASANGYAILPNPRASSGAEMLYLAVDEEPFPNKPPRKTAQNSPKM